VHEANLYRLVNAALGDWRFNAHPSERHGDPRFVDSTAGDYRLQPHSPAIDAGLVLGYESDFAGLPRPHGATPDIGAHEYQEP